MANLLSNALQTNFSAVASGPAGLNSGFDWITFQPLARDRDTVIEQLEL